MQTSIKTRISEELKNNAMTVLNDCGLTVSSAIRLFLEQVVQSQGLPFEVKRRPSTKTLAALQEAKELEIKAEHRYHSVETMLKGLNDKQQTE
ncbi:addiction module antitoxin RelB [Photorhabdus temperata]|uniref:Type II toxin-antitoxin system antitoxin, RelB/DinJ family n=3 Tax=Photorhabdus TaxID=29487 RepID=A0A7X5TMG4_9GAMM|nr:MULTISPECIES: type II toxin-antitoxin system RelB/DinJ family antitoxin [Photorhabdus]ETS29587.1 addiction module antitoxin, RelB/DinJ family [Photorhabdus khanii NC19]MQL48984.1 type II toxin-antitoxin system RelB/DinJ family antitoxin [Photorhabdus khanii]NHB98150.1 type II toxin-antitoxin system antitoxin, RelB/DinJ family [Photorhabdus stackebrandtii]OHV52356.1 addiction module antitoxin RelB [Photorhabdus temperata]